MPYLCCKTEHKIQPSFCQRQKILKCLWSKNVELQKCGHTGKSNYGLKLSIILMFLTIYGVEKSQCDRSIGLWYDERASFAFCVVSNFCCSEDISII